MGVRKDKEKGREAKGVHGQQSKRKGVTKRGKDEKGTETPRDRREGGSGMKSKLYLLFIRGEKNGERESESGGGGGGG